jgi:hypothetical protein
MLQLLTTHLVDEEDTRDQLCNTLFDVLVDNLVDLSPQLVRNFRPSSLDQLSHHTHDILSSLRSSIRHVQIMERHILDKLFALVHISLG